MNMLSILTVTVVPGITQYRKFCIKKKDQVSNRYVIKTKKISHSLDVELSEDYLIELNTELS